MGFDYEKYRRVKEPHDKLFIQGIWIYTGWIDRIGMISMILLLLSISFRGWIK